MEAGCSEVGRGGAFLKRYLSAECWVSGGGGQYSCVIRRFFRGLAQGLAEMKKTGSKRVSGYEAGLGSAVLDAPEENYARETEARSPWQGRGPAPAGALQRGYGSEDFEGSAASGYGVEDEPEYVPKRGNFRAKFRGIPRGIAGRIVLGVVVFGVLGAVVVAVAEVRSYLMHDARFMVADSDDIEINGAEHLTREQVLSVFGADLERNIFRVSLPERKADLERLPWVEHATVMRLLPDRIRVQIKERTPVAFMRQGTQIGLVDASGVLLDMTPEAAGDPHYSFPVLTGLSADLPLDTRAARMDVYQHFMAALRGADEHLTDSLSEVDVSDPEDVKALIASGSSDILVHFGNEEYVKRYHEFEQHLQEWKQQYPKLASADMRYDGQVVLEMQNGAGVTPGAEGGAATPAAPAVPTAAVSTSHAATKPAGLKLVAANEKKAAATKPAATRLVATKPAATQSVVTRPVPVKSAAASTSVAMAPAASQSAAPKLEIMKPPVTQTAPAHPAAVKPGAWKPAAKKPAAKKPVARKKTASGKSSANEKEFAALAAAHKAALAKAGKSGGVTP